MNSVQKAIKKAVGKSKVDPDQLRMGIECESREHPQMNARLIATQHLQEIPDYYTRLEKMEEEAKKDLTKETDDE